MPINGQQWFSMRITAPESCHPKMRWDIYALWSNEDNLNLGNPKPKFTQVVCWMAGRWLQLQVILSQVRISLPVEKTISTDRSTHVKRKKSLTLEPRRQAKRHEWQIAYGTKNNSRSLGTPLNLNLQAFITSSFSKLRPRNKFGRTKVIWKGLSSTSMGCLK